MYKLITILALALALAIAHSAQITAAAERSVWLVDLDGAVGPASADLVIRSIEEAGEAGAVAIVIRMDTPGGLDLAMRDIVKAILGARLPVITYVSPGGARAASAGTYITYASHFVAMAPATNIGSSTPVSIAPSVPSAPSPLGGDDEEEDSKPAPDTPDAMTRKIINDAVAYLQSLAELRGRNIEWAEETVREGANLRASEALEKNVIDLIAADLGELLEALDGREVELDGRTVQLATAGAVVERVETDWRHELLTVITDPSIAYGLLLVGFYGLILEFYNPGMVFPSVLGVICLLLGAYGLQMLPINYVGLALIVVGIGLMIAEVFSPSFGVLGIGGVVAFVFGSIMLIDSDLPGYQLPIPIIAGFALSTGLLAFLAVGAAVRARSSDMMSGVEAMVGGEARALGSFEGTGRVWAFGENWVAQSEEPVEEGSMVRINEVDGLKLIVEPIQED
ncbi:MAG: nodulation protein NfeD [Pseudomonadales bacterium]|jgi:membrane-bound serine protease (ClpP class)|nr:nodulation protein NfeD [Pseudomonadales bacterium]MDP6471058.1 nodulation protein NfeD [Pseudomonadales bacterium]MDP6825756.1 nodulation protein NfeD [Pseudomonadales bacterium]MDP6970727.1 nodulation protein NfeD [Pseudomonadales bacterium]